MDTPQLSTMCLLGFTFVVPKRRISAPVHVATPHMYEIRFEVIVQVLLAGTVGCLDQQFGVWAHLLFEYPPDELPESGFHVFESETVGDLQHEC
jgi:hypothetical protein